MVEEVRQVQRLILVPPAIVLEDRMRFDGEHGDLMAKTMKLYVLFRRSDHLKCSFLFFFRLELRCPYCSPVSQFKKRVPIAPNPETRSRGCSGVVRRAGTHARP